MSANKTAQASRQGLQPLPLEPVFRARLNAFGLFAFEAIPDERQRSRFHKPRAATLRFVPSHRGPGPTDCGRSGPRTHRGSGRRIRAALGYFPQNAAAGES